VVYLNEKRFTYITAADGEEALEKFKANSVDFIMLDLMMPMREEPLKQQRGAYILAFMYRAQ